MDISNVAIHRAKERLGTKANRIKWITTDVSDFVPTEKYDFWHDRAAFHFLTDENEIENYTQTTVNAIVPDGILVIGTFSEQGPIKCSGIEIKQYSEQTMTSLFENHFQKINCILVDHMTPSNTIQNFVFCSFRKN